MSETEVKKEAEAVEEQKNAVNKDAVPAETSPLKNDAEDLGKAVTKPSDPDGQTAVDKVKKYQTRLIKTQRTDLYQKIRNLLA